MKVGFIILPILPRTNISLIVVIQRVVSKHHLLRILQSVFGTSNVLTALLLQTENTLPLYPDRNFIFCCPMPLYHDSLTHLMAIAYSFAFLALMLKV